MATADELVDMLIAAMPATDGLATQGRILVRGLVRVLSDRQRQLAEADPDHAVLFWRRRGGVMWAVAESPPLLDAPSRWGPPQTSWWRSPGAVVPAARAYAELRPLAERVTDRSPALLTQTRLAELAAGLATSPSRPPASARARRPRCRRTRCRSPRPGWSGSGCWIPVGVGRSWCSAYPPINSTA